MSNEEFGFDSEFMDDDEVDQELDSFIELIGKNITGKDSEISFINPYRIRQVSYVYKTLRYLMKDVKGAKVTYELYEPYESTGSVSVVGKNLVFRRPDWFVKAVELADNLDVYPKVDGTVQMDFTFYGLTSVVK